MMPTLSLSWHRRIVRLAYLGLCSLGASVGHGGQALAGAPVHVVEGTTAKVCQVVGEYDRQIMAPTLNRTESRAKFWGTDLGASFEHEGKLYVLFGDTHPVFGTERPRDADSIAFSETKNPEDCLELSFLIDPDGGFRPLQIPGVYTGAFAVPSGGFSVGGRMYMLTTSDAPERGPMARSVLARSDDDGESFQRVYDLSFRTLIHVSPALVPKGQVAGLPPHEGEGVLFWGTGPFRRSDPHLAFIPADRIEDHASLRHFAGLDPATGAPLWSADETASVPLFEQPCMGEFSAGWNPFVEKWMLLYTCSGPRATTMIRTADHPWGPWSEAEILFDPARETGGCSFLNTRPQPMIVPAGGRDCPVVSDPHTPGNLGEAYGPYLISRFITGEQGVSSTIYFLMSTWNPYTVVLMKTTLSVGPKALLPPPAPAEAPPIRDRH